MLLDKTQGSTVAHTVFGVPDENGKGVLVSPTVDRNLLLGPTAHRVPSASCTGTTQNGLNTVQSLAQKSVPGVQLRAVITSFAGVRASVKDGDFIITPSKTVPGLIHAAGIDSPGLTACVAIARRVVTLAQNCGLALKPSPNFNPRRKNPHAFRAMSVEEKNAYIKKHPEYGKIICRCEGVSEGEIKAALRQNPKPQDLDGVKRRTRSGMGRCQGGLKRNIVQCLQDYNIPLYLSTTVAEIHGAKRVEGVTVAKVDENRQILPETKRFIPCDTLLLSVGLIPENELTRGAGILLDPVTGGAAVDENRQTGAPGIFACGNVLQVHDLVDYVSDEAELAGKGAAGFVLGSLPGGDLAATKAGPGVRYVLPQKVHSGCVKPVALFLRVSRPMGKVKYTVCSGGVELTHCTRLKAAPGEMEKIVLQPQQLQKAENEITVSLEELK